MRKALIGGAWGVMLADKHGCMPSFMGLRHSAKIKIQALLVYGSVFGVAPKVTYNEYVPLGAP